MIGLATAAWVTIGIALLFLLLMLLTWAWGLLKQTKALLRDVRTASERVSEALEEVSRLAREAGERTERISRPRRAP